MTVENTTSLNLFFVSDWMLINFSITEGLAI